MSERILVPCFDATPIATVLRSGGVMAVRESRPPLTVRPSTDINKVFIGIDGCEVLIDPWALSEAMQKCIGRSRR